MKNLITALFLFIAPLTAFSQTQRDYEHVIERFMHFYNKGNADSIGILFFDNDGLWTQKTMENSLKNYGVMKLYKYMGVNPKDGVMLFKSVFSKEYEGKSVHAIGIHLGKENNVGTFRFFANSHYIDSLLTKY